MFSLISSLKLVQSYYKKTTQIMLANWKPGYKLL
jgi:hypothetical protein